MDKETLVARAQERIALVGSRTERGRSSVLGAYVSGNPSADLLSIRAKKSESNAIGIYSIDNPQYYDAHDEMVRKDATISSTLALIVSQIAAREMTFRAKDPNNATAVRAAEYLTEQINSKFLLDAVNYFVGGAIRHGMSTCEVEWRERNGYFIPHKLHHQHPGLFCFNDSGEMFWYRSYIGTNDRDGSPVSPWKFATMRFPALYGNPFGDCPLDKIDILFYVKKEAIKAWSDYTYRFGLPLPKATITADNDEDYQKRMTELREQLDSLATSSGIILPKAIDLQFDTRGGGQSSAPHEPLVKFCDTQILRFLYGSTLGVAEAEYGTRAMAEVHASTGNQRHKNTAQLFGDAIQQVVDAFVEINFGADLVGTVLFDVDTDDARDLDEAIKALDQAAKMGLAVSESQTRDWLNLQNPEGDDAIGREASKAGEVYQYHLDYGILNKNEVRDRLGLPPTADGEERPMPSTIGASPIAGQQPVPFAEDDKIEPPPSKLPAGDTTFCSKGKCKECGRVNFNCGTGDGGFKPGNDCAGGSGGESVSISDLSDPSYDLSSYDGGEIIKGGPDYAYHIVSSDWSPGQPLKSLSKRVDDGDIEPWKAARDVYTKWQWDTPYALEDMDEDDWSELARSGRFEDYLSRDGQENHFVYGTDDAKEIWDQIGGPGKKILRVKVSEYDVRNGFEYPHPVIRGEVRPESISVVDGVDGFSEQKRKVPALLPLMRTAELPAGDRREVLSVSETDAALLGIANAIDRTESERIIKDAIAGKEIEVTPEIEKAFEAAAIVALAADLVRLSPPGEIESFAEYNGRTVELNKPFRTPDGPKKFAVYVQNENGNTIRLPFGDPDSEIRRDDPDARKNFRARHGCDDPGPKWKARYWSCRFWDAESVSDIIKASEGCGCGCGNVAKFAEVEELDPLFRPAVEWMQAREVMSRAALDSIIEVLARSPRSLVASYTREQLTQLVRGRAVAFKLATSAQQASALKAATIQAVNNGTTLGKFLDTVDGDAFVRGKFGDGYMQNVFRTETSNAYSAQQQSFENLPAVQSVLWGYRVMNPEDGRSRPGHAALDGALFRNGSPAFERLGRPPFSYQCRCVMVPIPKREAERNGYVETPNAMQLAAGVERF